VSRSPKCLRVFVWSFRPLSASQLAVTWLGVSHSHADIPIKRYAPARNWTPLTLHDAQVRDLRVSWQACNLGLCLLNLSAYLLTNIVSFVGSVWAERAYSLRLCNEQSLWEESTPPPPPKHRVWIRRSHSVPIISKSTEHSPYWEATDFWTS